MTGARQKASLRQSRGGGTERRDSCPSRRPPHADAMDQAWTERSLRFGRTKRINETVAVTVVRQGQEEGVAKRMRSDRKRKRCSSSEQQKKKRKPERRRRRDKKRDRKSYPLRGRGGGGGGGGGSEDEGLSCHVLLTRVDEAGDKEEPKGPEDRRSKHGRTRRSKLSLRKPRASKKRKGSGEPEAKIVTPKNKPKSNSPSPSDGGWVASSVPVEPPRKRRLASLNAEAVNSLLLERATATDPNHQPAAKQAKRQQQEEPGAGAGASPDADPAAKSGCPPPPPPPGAAPPSKASRGGGAGKASPPNNNNNSKPPPPCQSSKQAKKANNKACQGGGGGDEGGVGAVMSRESLDAPAPRRLAGLNAAALLRLTSSSASSKQRVRAAPAATAVAADCKAPTTAASATPKQQPRVKLKPKECSQQKQKGEGSSSQQGGGSTAANKAGFEPKVEWETGSCTHRLTKPGYQQRSSSMLAYPLKSVKEEQVETELSPYYCCPPEGSVEYCHRLAFFLGQEAYRTDPDDASLTSAMTPVKRECLVTSPSLTHSHPHHAALALSPHPCLCAAEHCFSHGYYVHIAPHHPAHTGTAPATLANTRPLNFGPSTLCPSSRMAGSKLLGPRVSHPSGLAAHPSGLAHPAAFCGSVGSPCYGEACRISGCAYRAMPPVASRGCTFSTGCTGCTHSIKTESYSSSQGEQHGPSLLVSPALSGCPLPSVSPPSSTQAKPRLLPPPHLAERGREHQPPPPASARLKPARECPQGSAKPSRDGSVSPVRVTRLSQKQPVSPTRPAVADAATPSLGGAKQKRISRRRATNGWRPVGVPTEKDVFIAGEEETSLRQCYEGVERDGEVIRIRDTVLLRSGPRKKSLPYVAKISALWEDPKTGEMMMSLFWYYRPEHTQGGRDPSAHCENEIFASRHQDENSVACIEDRCYVLPLAQYCRFCALVKRRAEAAPTGRPRVVPGHADFTPPSHRCVPADVDPELVYLCRHVYDFRYGRILKNLQ